MAVESLVVVDGDGAGGEAPARGGAEARRGEEAAEVGDEGSGGGGHGDRRCGGRGEGRREIIEWPWRLRRSPPVNRTASGKGGLEVGKEARV